MKPSFTISLGCDCLILRLPSGRALEVGINEHGARAIERTLRLAETMAEPEAHGGLFPTQHLIDRWMKEDREAKRKELEEEAKRKAALMGIDRDELRISI